MLFVGLRGVLNLLGQERLVVDGDHCLVANEIVLKIVIRSRLTSGLVIVLVLPALIRNLFIVIHFNKKFGDAMILRRHLTLV